MSEKLSSGQKARSKVHSFDDLFNTSTDMGFGHSVQNEKYHVEEINLSEMHEFPNHPFPVVDDDEMAELVASIGEHGVLQAAVVRSDPSGGYQIISGHRRHMACMKLGYEKMPAVVVEMDDEDATTCMVDANFSQRKEIPISCKVRAYRQKFDAQKKKGKITATYDELGEAAGESGKTVQRMLRLSYLSDELLDLMDVGKLGVVQGVSISYLDEDDQQLVLVAIEDTQVNMNKDQAQKIRELGESKSLNLEVIRMLLTDKKKKERKYTMKSDIISRYFEEDAKCYFSVPKDVIEKCKMKYKGEDAYGLILSNKFIMGLHCICEAARAEYAVDMTITETDSSYMKAMALYNIKEVIFQCLLLDDVKEEDGMIVASLYTIYVLE